MAPKPESIDDINMELEITDLQSSIYLDTAYVFKKYNPAIPKETKYHSFLLDKEDNVQFVGSPIDNEKIKNDYYIFICGVAAQLPIAPKEKRSQ